MGLGATIALLCDTICMSSQAKMADPIGAEDAERMGLINHVTLPEETLNAAQAFAQRLAGGPTAAIRWTRVSANIGLKQLAHSIMDTSLTYEWLTLQADDHREAIRAFLEKRKPTFTDT
jgi:enoyl-CoA hydratase